ncbi:MAG TPA: hypothetical protein VI749_04980 [Candidatus Omnitrophota bacterium]|nr:hypothetical protein [Candidatus Omnitrophota bacterium]
MKWKITISLLVFLGVSPLSVHAKELLTFSGSVDLTQNQFDIDVTWEDQSFIKAKGLKTVGKDYLLTLDIEHMKSPYFDLSSQIQSSLIFDKAGSAVSGELSSQYSLIDYKPTKELSGRFEIKGDRVYLTSLSFSHIAFNGFVEFMDPFAVDMLVEMDQLPLEDFLDFWTPHSKLDSSGVVGGEIKLAGTLDKLQMRGNLQVYDGHIENLLFDNIHLNAQGVYPLLQVAQTSVSKADGVSFMVDGPVDISDQLNFKKQIKALHISPLVTETATKKEWTIKRLHGTEMGSTELKYLLRKDISGSTVKEESALLGVEQKLEF